MILLLVDDDIGVHREICVAYGFVFLILDFIDLFYDILMDFNYLAAPQLSVQNSIKTQKNINYKRNAERPPSLN